MSETNVPMTREEVDALELADGLDRLEKTLVYLYGTQIKPHLPILLKKIDAVILAHMYPVSLPNSAAVCLNMALDSFLKEM